MKKLQTKDKLRGGYYTPIEIVNFLVMWALNGSNEIRTILEPSMGDGAFIIPIAKELTKRRVHKDVIAKNIYGVELFREEVEKVKKTLQNEGYDPKKFNLINGDFFSAIKGKLGRMKFDLVLGNPPFIRYQNFPEKQREFATEVLLKNGFHPNKLTNAWLFFLITSVFTLKDDGKLAMVIPAELLQVSYAAEARVFLSNFFQSITIVSFKKLAFQNIQQEIVLLLCDNNTKAPKGINLMEISDMGDLPPTAEVKTPSRFKPIQHNTDKWTQYFLTQSEILLLRKLKNIKRVSRLGDILSVDVGIVTGNNDFFVVTSQTVKKYNLEQHVVPLIGRSAQFGQGFHFSKKDWENLNSGNGLCYLFSYNQKIEKTTKPGIKKYLEIGLKNGVVDGYKCGIRKLWHEVPSIWIPDALMLRQIHTHPRLILNDAKVVPTDTIHRVRINSSMDKQKLAASFHNSLTFAFSEIVGRSYGGGVLELEPSEAENLMLPYLPESDINLAEIEKIIKKEGIEKGLDYSDKILLEDGLGLSKKDVVALRQIWIKLSKRRMKRKNKSSKM